MHPATFEKVDETFTALRALPLRPPASWEIPRGGAVQQAPLLPEPGAVECSWGLYFNAQPMWGQRGAVGVRRFTAASQPLTASWGRSIRREGENSPSQGLSLPRISSASTMAAAMAEVMPHLL